MNEEEKKILLTLEHIQQNGCWTFDFDEGQFYYRMNNNLYAYFRLTVTGHSFDRNTPVISYPMLIHFDLNIFDSGRFVVRDIFLQNELK